MYTQICHINKSYNICSFFLRWIWNLGPFAKCGFWVCKETYQNNNHSASNLEIHPNLASWFNFNLFAHASSQTNICIGRKEACNEIIITWVFNLERVLTVVPLPRFQSAIPGCHCLQNAGYHDRAVADPSKWFWGGVDCEEEEGMICCPASENVCLTE